MGMAGRKLVVVDGQKLFPRGENDGRQLDREGRQLLLLEFLVMELAVTSPRLEERDYV
jgi:hypothetical protein